MTEKFIIVKDDKVVYDTGNYLNLKRKSEKIEGNLYEKM